VTDETFCTDDTQCEFYCPSILPYYCSEMNICVLNKAACNSTCTGIPTNGTICMGSDQSPPVSTPATVTNTCTTTPNTPACQYQCLSPNPYYCLATNSCLADESYCAALSLEILDNE